MEDGNDPQRSANKRKRCLIYIKADGHNLNSNVRLVGQNQTALNSWGSNFV